MKILQPDITGLPQITGNNFNTEIMNVLEEIKTFMRYQENSSFPKRDLQLGIYKLLKDSLNKLDELNREDYITVIQDDLINEKIETFRNLEFEFI